MNDFRERKALVTGAGAGIGRAIALRLAAAGAAVACADIDGAAAEAVAREITALETSPPALALQGDVADEAQSAQLVDSAAETLAGLDILVNNAGITIIKRLEESSVEEWDRTLATNLRSMFLTCRRAIPALRDSPCPAIVNLASMAAFRFTVPHIPYAASKAGVAVAPGPIATQIVGNLTDEQIAQAGLRFLLGRMGRPADVAEAVAFLASQRASYITGATLPVTGGAELATRALRAEDA